MQKAFKQCARVCQYVYVSISIVMFSFCEMGDGSNIKKTREYYPKNFQTLFLFCWFFFCISFRSRLAPWTEYFFFGRVGV